jgi:hypothetical protein
MQARRDSFPHDIALTPFYSLSKMRNHFLLNRKEKKKRGFKKNSFPCHRGLALVMDEIYFSSGGRNSKIDSIDRIAEEQTKEILENIGEEDLRVIQSLRPRFHGYVCGISCFCRKFGKTGIEWRLGILYCSFNHIYSHPKLPQCGYAASLMIDAAGM